MFLWTGKIISLIGDKFYAIALAWWILQETNSPKIMGFFLLVTVLPGLITGFFAGAMVDRRDRIKILVLADILRGLLIFAVVVLYMSKSLMVWNIFLIGAALSTVTAFFDPAVQAIIPQVVDRADLTKANSMNQMVSGICAVIGPVLGAGIISLFGINAVFIFNGFSFLISALMEKQVRLNSAMQGSSEVKPIIHDVIDGLLFLKENRNIIRIIIIIAVTHFFMGSLMVQLPFLAKGFNGNGVQNLGYLETMLGTGLLLGAVYMSRKKNKRLKERQLIYLILLVGLCILVISALLSAAMKAVIPYMIAFMIIGCIISDASVFWLSLIQMNTPEHMAGRIFGISTLPQMHRCRLHMPYPGFF
jgi:MFS family permease